MQVSIFVDRQSSGNFAKSREPACLLKMEIEIMGEAKKRGNFEQRKKQAIDEGREKIKARGRYSIRNFYPGFPGGIMNSDLTIYALSAAINRKRRVLI